MMLKKIVVGVASVTVAGAATLLVLTVPMLRRLPRPSRVTVEGITTIDDAVAACRQTGLDGWELVGYAQHLVARKFTYSRLNPWDSSSRAFERGRGYCQQQALALKRIYDRLGIQARPVYARRCFFPPKLVDGMPWPGGVVQHAWLRVWIGPDECDVCPGALANSPGVTPFTVLSPIRVLSTWLCPFAHLGSVIENIRRDWIARHSRPEAEPMCDSAPFTTPSAVPIT